MAAATLQEAAILVREVAEVVLPKSTQTLSVARKLFLGVWLCGPLQNADWDGVCMSVVRSVAQDARGQLNTIPETWDAAEVSRVFFGRPDRAPFLSMWSCLFRDVAKICDKDPSPKAGDYMLRQLRSGEFLSVASASIDGLTENPAEVAKQILRRHGPGPEEIGGCKKVGRKHG